MKCHEVDYEIFGDDLQAVEVELFRQVQMEVPLPVAVVMEWLEEMV